MCHEKQDHQLKRTMSQVPISFAVVDPSERAGSDNRSMVEREGVLKISGLDGAAVKLSACHPHSCGNTPSCLTPVLISDFHDPSLVLLEEVTSVDIPGNE